MKRCPTCNRTYANDEFAFCLNDGTLLSAPYDLDKTLVAPPSHKSDLPITEVLSLDGKFSNKEVERADGSTRNLKSRRKCDVVKFFEEVRGNPNAEIRKAVRTLYDLSDEVADKLDFGSGSQRCSFNVKFSHISRRSLYSVFSDGSLQLNFSWLTDAKSAKVAARFGQELRRTFGPTISNDFRERRIAVSAEQWIPQINAFIDVVRAVTKE
ncbi:MAG TPA: hypothetical protein VGC89_16610 [Pyrinomonadaceae bacterium]|jgi:hypothetical protein